MTDVLIRIVVRSQNAWFRARREADGQSLVEYALIISVVAIGAIMALIFLREEIKGLFSKAGSSVREGLTAS